jgi:hypothetical protein
MLLINMNIKVTSTMMGTVMLKPTVLTTTMDTQA